MKHRNILLTLLLLAVALPTFISCGVDRYAEWEAQTVRDRWIDSIMRANYLWYNEMKTESELNYFNDPTAFITAAVPSQDRGFTTADTILLTPQLSYGYEYTLFRAAVGDTAFNALVTYILPSSPTTDAGLKRGEWIMKVNGNLITDKNKTDLLNGTAALDLVIGKYTEQQNPDQTVTGIVVEDHAAFMPAARVVEDNPVNYYNTYTRAGQKVGYVVYSHFTAGNLADPAKYNNELRSISNVFNSEGVSTVILDFRYNPGGETECAQLLGTLIAPANKLGTLMASLEYNDKRQSENRQLLFDPILLQTGSNINANRFIVLSTSVTAGASEMILNCMENIALLGQPTVGMNVGTKRYRNPQVLWSLNLVEYTIFNSNHESLYANGFAPNFSLDEKSDLMHFLPFGDESETLLNAALGVIDGTYPPQ